MPSMSPLSAERNRHQYKHHAARPDPVIVQETECAPQVGHSLLAPQIVDVGDSQARDQRSDPCPQSSQMRPRPPHRINPAPYSIRRAEFGLPSGP